MLYRTEVFLEFVTKSDQWSAHLEFELGDPGSIPGSLNETC